MRRCRRSSPARAESLLAYLLLHRDAPQPRQRLAFLLWPDSSEAQARTNLRHVLHTLRRALPDADRFLDVAPRTLRWRRTRRCWLDVAVFEEALARRRGSRRARSGRTTAAICSRAATTTGCSRSASGCAISISTRSSARPRGAGARRLGRAVRYAERLVRHDPLREETYRLLMRLHAARGDRARALRAYHVCTATLERELGVEPSAATREAYEALLPAAPGARPSTAAR